MSTQKKTLLGSMITCKCPECRAGNLFINPKAYSFNQFGKQNQFCPVCGSNMMPEPGFYFGAAYVSWGLTVALWVSVLIALKVLNYFGVIEFGFLTHPLTFLVTGVVCSLLLFPLIFRLSRSIWAHMFIKNVSASSDSH